MSEERLRILKMVADGKVTPEEGEKLLNALNQPAVQETGTSGGKDPKFLRVKVDGDDQVDIRVPFGILRTGIKLTALIPPLAMAHIDEHIKKKGIDFDINMIRKEDLDELIAHLAQMQIDVKSRNGENVRVYCE